MKPILLLFPVIGFLAFISAETIFKSQGILPSAKNIPFSTVERSAVIGCAPDDANSGATGSFIPALPGLGHHKYTITTRQDSTRFFFNQGLNFYYSYHLREALASFREAALFDSTAAMTYWGQALSMGPYYNMYYYKLKKGVPDALAAMNRHRAGATEKEKALMDAIQQRYSTDTTNADRPQLDSTYAAAMSGLVKHYPGDNDIKALYIDAVMLEHKWDFWNTDRTPKAWTPELVKICETILKKDPHHPGGLHYYIHLTEASDKPELALPWANVLKDEMPGAGHMVHMATHSYQRNGLFVKGVKVNEDANTVVNREDSLAPGIGIGKNKIIHVYEVQSYCAMNAGMYSKGMPIFLRARERLLAGKPLFEQDPDAQFVYMFPVLAWVRLGKWDEIQQSPAPNNQWKYASILYHFASGLGNVHYKNLPAAKADLDSLEGDLQDSLLGIRIMPFNKPAQCGRVAAGILRGEILFAEGKQEDAVAALNLAVQEEDGLIYSEPPEWLIPVRQYLGLCLLKMNKAKEAERIYKDDLSRNPGNGWSLLGLYQSLIAQHKPAEAAGYKLKYQKAFEASDVNPVASVF